MRILLFLTVFSFIAAAAEFKDIPAGIEGVSPQGGNQLQKAFNKFTGGTTVFVPDKYLPFLTDFAAASVFNGQPAHKIPEMTFRLLRIVMSGAPENESAELMDAAYGSDIPDRVIIGAAEAMSLLKKADIPPEVYYDYISYALYEKWEQKKTVTGAAAVVKAAETGLDPAKAAVALAVRFSKDLGKTSVSKAAAEEIKNLDRLKNYEAVEKAAAAGVPQSLANDIYMHGKSQGWPDKALFAVLDGLSEGKKKGLTLEKLALAMAVRMDSGLKTSPEEMVKEEINFVTGLESEKKRQKIISKNPAMKKQLTGVKKTQDGKGVLNIELLEQSVMSFYRHPTKYKWGGTKRGGADCSGFVQTCYREQGMEIPRVSRFQYAWLKKANRLVSKNSLRKGDLVFFNSNGHGRISHVGMYWSEGKFVHSCSSKGVTFTPLNKPYYVKRFVNSGRVTGKSI